MHLVTLLLAVVLLLQAAVLWELFVLRQRLAVALPQAFGISTGVGAGWWGLSAFTAVPGDWVGWLEALFSGGRAAAGAAADGTQLGGGGRPLLDAFSNGSGVW